MQKQGEVMFSKQIQNGPVIDVVVANEEGGDNGYVFFGRNYEMNYKFKASV